MHNYDIIIVGAGSIGIPTAMALSNFNMKILVIDAKASPGQGDNKKAIGGVRATHSDPSKILIGKRSLEIFSTWEYLYGDKIEWMAGGYLFPIYRNKEKKFFKTLLSIQQKSGLKIDFIEPKEVKNLIPGINDKNLIGGTFSPNDGSASPLLSINAFTKQAIKKGVEFRFKEDVKKIIVHKNKVLGLQTNKEKYNAPIIINAAGALSSNLCKTAGINIQVKPDSHEAGITEPVKRIFKCMVVDLRPGPKSKNFYLYQNIHGQIVFCITPDPPILGTSTNETSTFLPKVCNRIVNLIPILSNIRVRRIWRGCYPMSPDGSPIVGWDNKIEGIFHVTGMCGQGFMLGPGIGEFTSRIITQTCTDTDKDIELSFSPKRKFSEHKETLK